MVSFYILKVAISACKERKVCHRFIASCCNCRAVLTEEDPNVLDGVRSNPNPLTCHGLSRPKPCANISIDAVSNNTNYKVVASNSLIFDYLKINNYKLKSLR